MPGWCIGLIFIVVGLCGCAGQRRFRWTSVDKIERRVFQESWTSRDEKSVGRSCVCRKRCDGDLVDLSAEPVALSSCGY